MSRRCAIQGCKNSGWKNNEYAKVKYKRVTFHKFPDMPTKRKLWLTKTGRKSSSYSQCHYICSQHFAKTDYLYYIEKAGNPAHCRLKPTAVPSLKLPRSSKRSPKKQKVINLVIEADPVLLWDDADDLSSLSSLEKASSVPDVTNDNEPMIINPFNQEDNSQSWPNIPLSELRIPLYTLNTTIPIENENRHLIHYDHSYALPYADCLLSKAVLDNTINNSTTYHNGKKLKRALSTVETMTDMSGTDCERLNEFESEIRWLWQRNNKLEDDVSLLKSRNREWVTTNLRTRKELLLYKKKFDDLKQKLNKLEKKYFTNMSESEGE